MSSGAPHLHCDGEAAMQPSAEHGALGAPAEGQEGPAFVRLKLGEGHAVEGRAAGTLKLAGIQ